MSNSSLVNYVKISPHSSNPRNNTIKKITIHHMAGNLSVETCGNVFQTRQASSNYGIDSQGRVGMYVEEKNRAWTSSSKENDNQAVTIEVANDEIGGNWHVSDVAYAKLIDLCVDICKRNNIKQLNYTGDKNGNLTMHCFFTNTTCPGPYLKSKFPDIANEVNRRLNENNNTNENDFIEQIAFYVNKHREKYNIQVTSPIVAQAILESAKGTSSKAKFHNYFGLKYRANRCQISNEYFVDGSAEQNADGSYTNISTKWFKFNSMEDGVIGYFQFINTSNYNSLKGETNPKVYLEKIKAAGYATSLKYVDNLMNVINTYNLTRFDNLDTNNETNNEYDTIYYVVQKGDYLSRICSKYCVKVDDVVSWNNIKDKNKIYVGQKIEIRTYKEQKEKTTHIVEEGDTLASISNKYSISVADLVRINNLIQVGQELKIKG